MVFIHGLGGHPVRTWSALSTYQGSESTDRRPSASTESVASSRDANAGRKGSLSLWSKFKRSKTGTLTERSMSIAQSTYSLDATSAGVSSPEPNIDSLTAEPDTISPLLPSPQAPTSNPLSRTASNITVPLASAPAGKKLQVYWPRDLLPSDIPDARIYTYGYDADVVKKPFSKDSEADTEAGAEDNATPKGKLNFAQHAHDLMVTLNRELPENVPVILCAHSLGGVLAKRVCILAKYIQTEKQLTNKL